MVIGNEGQVRRKCSGRLRIPGREEPNFKELTGRLREQFGERSISGVQQFGRGRFELFFATEGHLNIAAEQGFLYGNEKHDIEPIDTPVKWLFVKYAPFELDRGDFEQHLAPYGQVRSIEFVYPEEIKPWHNGERKISFVMKREVPNFLKIGIYTVQIRYAGVVSLCRKCHGNGHVARDCKSDKCRKCGLSGHQEAGCTLEMDEDMSPETQRIVIQARDLLKNQKAAEPVKALTMEEELSEQETSGGEEGEETETEDESGCGDEVPEQEDGESEGMPELESEEEPEDALEQQDLEREKYLKEKEGSKNERGSHAGQKEGHRKKKMTKQERRKRRQTEERERNNKREREESKSPTGEMPRERKKREDEKGETQEESEKGKETKGERKEQNEKEEYWLFFEWGDKTFGEVKEIINTNFGVGIVKHIDRRPSGLWTIMFTEMRWADQAARNGLRENKTVWFPKSKKTVTQEKAKE